MIKNLKLNIKNTQLAEAVKLGSLKEKLKTKKKTPGASKSKPQEKQEVVAKETVVPQEKEQTQPVEESPKIVQPKERPAAVEKPAAIHKPVRSQTRIYNKPVLVRKAPVPPPAAKAAPAKPVKSAPQPRPVARPVGQFQSYRDRHVYKPKVTPSAARPKLGPTGRHISDFLPPKETKEERHKAVRSVAPSATQPSKSFGRKAIHTKEFKDVKSIRKPKTSPTTSDDDGKWRKKRSSKKSMRDEVVPQVPSSLTIKLPIAIKDFANALKVKASLLITKLFMEGMSLTLNDYIDDETLAQLLGAEWNCTIEVDKSEDNRINITDQTIQEEITQTDAEALVTRPPVVAFMGHVDHGKTSLIDAIRHSKIADGEAGAITQHMGAFVTETKYGTITILDTPGHEAFAAMRERGAQATDIVVLVVAGDEGIRAQTDEAIKSARSAGATLVVAINKCDKPNFNVENVYRQLAERELMPESWGGTVITVACSATTGEGIEQLLELVALQSEVLELRANPKARARGVVIEAKMHKGLGAVATLLVQTGTLATTDSLVFDKSYARVRLMRDDRNKVVKEAGPSQAVMITGLSELPTAGEEFVVVASEKEARAIAQSRADRLKEEQHRRKRSLDALLDKGDANAQKVLKLMLRADAQGSLEALAQALSAIQSEKVALSIVSSSVGEVTESDVELAAASGAEILGFHTKVQPHVQEIMRHKGVQVLTHNIIYKVVDSVRDRMRCLLDPIYEEEEKGSALIKALFRSSQVGVIAGCLVTDGTIVRSMHARVRRSGEVVWQGRIESIKRDKDDVKEVSKGYECGIVLQKFSKIEEGDTIEAYALIEIPQEL